MPDKSDKAPQAVQACSCSCDGNPVLLEDILCKTILLPDDF